eukprot:COSAG01_NODE_1119_length_11633_cov_4.612190_3_plen_53_part_00
MARVVLVVQVGAEAGAEAAAADAAVERCPVACCCLHRCRCLTHVHVGQRQML